MANTKIDLYKTILFIIALLGVIYFVNDIFKKSAFPISVIDKIENDNLVDIEDSKTKITKLKKELALSKKRELNLLNKLNLIQKNNEEINNKFDSTVYTNVELQRLFSTWSPTK